MILGAVAVILIAAAVLSSALPADRATDRGLSDLRVVLPGLAGPRSRFQWLWSLTGE